MMDHTQRVLKNYFPDSKEELVIDGKPLRDFIETYGTPLFIYNGRIAKAHLTQLQAALGCFDVFYSVKANPNPAWLEFFVRQGCGLSVATKGELDLARDTGCPAERIILAGAGKTDADLISGIKARVGEIHAESLSDLHTIEHAASLENYHVKIVLRFNAGEILKLRNGQFDVQKKAAAYGFEEESAREAIDLIESSRHLTFYGIHTYYGTQHLEYRGLLSAFKHTLELACRISSETGLPLQTIDFGGGFGIPYYPDEQSFGIEEFGAGLHVLLSQFHQNRNLKSAKLCVEPGRYLVGEAGLYVTRVIGAKISCGKKFVIIDGGVHHHLAATGRLGGPVRRNFPVMVGNRLDKDKIETVTIMGRQCNTLDTLARDVISPYITVGDVIVFPQSGAYTLSVSPQSFRCHPNATEIFLE